MIQDLHSDANALNDREDTQEVECARAEIQVDQRLGFKYRTVYLYDEESRMHCHDYYEVFLILAPDVVHYINGQIVHLGRGSLVFIRKEDRHTFEYATTKESSLCNLSFKEEILKELFQYLSKGYPSENLLRQEMPPTVQLEENDILWFQNQLNRLNAVVTEESLELQYHCRLFLMKLFTRYFIHATDVPENTEVPSWLVKLDQEMHMLENFREGTKRMIALSGKTKEHLGRMVKKCYGMTISEYVNHLRLNYFANTLVTSDIPILDLCFECGFQNVSYAYSRFKKKYGMSPLQYRKMNR